MSSAKRESLTDALAQRDFKFAAGVRAHVSASLDALVSAWFLEMTYELISQRRCRGCC